MTPDTYDRLERLSRMPYGRLTVRRLIARDKGPAVINYLAADPDGIKASELQGRNIKSRDFERRTGRIYTAELLLKRLKQSHAAAQQRQMETGPNRSATRPGVPTTEHRTAEPNG
jgi:hypothetical protein